MWRVTWQTGVAYLVMGPIYLAAHRALADPACQAPSVGAMATTGVLGWGLIVAGAIFLSVSLGERLVRRWRRT
jgi:hypothetical protein